MKISSVLRQSRFVKRTVPQDINKQTNNLTPTPPKKEKRCAAAPGSTYPLLRNQKVGTRMKTSPNCQNQPPFPHAFSADLFPQAVVKVLNGVGMFLVGLLKTQHVQLRFQPQALPLVDLHQGLDQVRPPVRTAFLQLCVRHKPNNHQSQYMWYSK